MTTKTKLCQTKAAIALGAAQERLRELGALLAAEGDTETGETVDVERLRLKSIERTILALGTQPTHGPTELNL